jgi:hypothetical protein
MLANALYSAISFLIEAILALRTFDFLASTLAVCFLATA